MLKSMNFNNLGQSQLLTILLITFLTFSYFYNFHISHKTEYIEFEYNIPYEDFQSQRGWSSLEKTEFDKGVLPVNSETNVYFRLPETDTYLFRITFYSKNKVELNQINAFLKDIELKKIGSGLKKEKKYIEFILPADNIKIGNNSLKLTFDKEIVNKLVFVTFKFQNFTGYNSHLPEFKVISDTSPYLKQIKGIKFIDTILVLICTIFFMLVSGYIWSIFSKSGFVSSIKNSSYSFVTAVFVYLCIIIASTLTKYHVLFYLDSFIVFTILITLLTELVLLYSTSKIARKNFVSLLTDFINSLNKHFDVSN